MQRQTVHLTKHLLHGAEGGVGDARREQEVAARGLGRGWAALARGWAPWTGSCRGTDTPATWGQQVCGLDVMAGDC